MPTPEFVDRINNPADYPYITNSNGSFSTHRMAAEVDGDGQWYAFPTIVQLPNGKLKQFETNQQAMEYNLKTGNYLEMPTKQDALKYSSGGYKKGTALETFRPPLIDKAEFE